MAKGNFGERLRRERELREVSLDEISVATKISGRYLHALENEEWSKLPGGVFARGFVRSIARYLGLDEESLLGDYDLARSKAPPGVPPPPLEPLPWEPPRWVPPVAGAIVFLLLVAGLIFAWMRNYVRNGVPPAEPSAAVSSQAPAAVPPQAGSPAQASAPVPTSVTAARTAPAQPESASAAKPAAETPPAPEKDRSAPEAALPPLELTVSTSAATRVRILADGKVKFDAQMPAGENLRYRAKSEFEVSAEDSSAVLLDLNGQAMPPIGSPGSSGTIKLNRKNLRRATNGTSQR